MIFSQTNFFLYLEAVEAGSYSPPCKDKLYVSQPIHLILCGIVQ